MADGFQLLRLAQGGFGLGQRQGALFDALLQGGVEFGVGGQAGAHIGVGTHALDIGPGALGDFPQHRQVVVRPRPRNFVMHGHQGGKTAVADQRHADGGGHPQRLELLGLVGRQFAQVVVDHQRLTGA